MDFNPELYLDQIEPLTEVDSSINKLYKLNSITVASSTFFHSSKAISNRITEFFSYTFSFVLKKIH